jgi:hypothetical protein
VECGLCVSVFDGGLVTASINDECRRPTSPFKEREEPSVLPSWISLQHSGGQGCCAFNYSPLLLPGQLNGATVFNNCPGYSSVTIYSFCAVL